MSEEIALKWYFKGKINSTSFPGPLWEAFSSEHVPNNGYTCHQMQDSLKQTFE